MGGKEGSRGYLYQALAAIAGNLVDLTWDYLTVEPESDSEKVDLRWDYPDRTKVVQVKSSTQKLGKSDIEGWAKELRELSPQAEEVELWIYARVRENAEKIVELHGVRIKRWPPPTEEEVRLLIKGSAHDLDKYLCQERLQLAPELRENFIECLVYRVFLAGSFSSRITREKLDQMLRGWVEQFNANRGNVFLREEDVRQKCELFSGVITSQVVQQLWLERKEEGEIRKAFFESDEKITFILGGPGSGKSALLAKITTNLQASGELVIAFRADDIERNQKANECLGDRIGYRRGFVEFIEECQMFASLTVMIDQLDALADLVDMTSGRLNDVIEIIRQISRFKNTKIICVCREFEREHDVRLKSIKGELIRLDLPSWDQVKEVLTGIPNADEWPDDFKEVLRTPQHLEIFLRIFDQTGHTEPFGSYQQMLDRLWALRITSAESRQLIHDLTLLMMGEESTFAPLASFEGREKVIHQLEALHILVVEKSRIRFRHQSLFEHAKARLFINGEQRFCEYVLRRQDATMVRPTIWAVLRYLRDVSTKKYHDEMSELLGSRIRLHVKLLLIDFLGQVQEPDLVEQRLLSKCLDDLEVRRRVLIAIQGNTGWFDAFSETRFPIVMRWESDLWPMINVLGKTWAHAHNEVLRLIETFWHDDSTKDEFTWSVIDDIDHWDERANQIASTLIERFPDSDDRSWLAERFVEVAARNRLDLALDLFLKEENLRRTNRSPLDKHHWDKLPNLARSESLLFLRKLWLWYVRACENLSSFGMSSVLNRYAGSTAVLDSDSDLGQKPVVSAMLIAVEEVARTDPAAFLQITKASSQSEEMVVHATLMRGLRHVVSSHRNDVQEYLFKDDRRFAIGDLYSENYSESCALIEALSRGADASLIEDLYQRILSWSKYKNPADISAEMLKWDRESRVLLLHSIPVERRSVSLQRFLEQEMAEVPDWRRHLKKVSFDYVEVISPLTMEEMDSATDQVLIDALTGKFPTALSESSSLDSVPRLGDIEDVESEFEKLAGKDPQRVLALIPSLIDKGLHSASARAIYGLRGSPLVAENYFQLALELDQRTPLADDIRSNIASRLYETADNDVELPDHICLLLRNWLFAAWEPYQSPFPKPKRNDDDSPTPLLRGTSRWIITVWPQYSLMRTLTRGYLDRDSPEYGKWLDVIDVLIDSSVSIEFWKDFCLELVRVRHAADFVARGVSCVIRLFEKHPDLIYEPHALNLILSLGSHCPPDFVQRILWELRSSSERVHLQLFGEFITTLKLRNHQVSWSSAFEDVLTEFIDDGDRNEMMGVGIAFSAAYGWDNPSSRHASWMILKRIIPFSTEKIAAAINTVFFSKHDFFADNDTDELFRMLTNQPVCFDRNYVIDMVIAAGSVVNDFPETVLGLCKAVVNTFGAELSYGGSRVFGVGAHLVDIAMTLQRIPETCDGGLVLLEELLRLGLDDAFQTLNKIDLRPGRLKRVGMRERRRRGLG